ncbi:1-acyl-sn-glycerol-3-phosphate acyltransferase [Pelistega sp. NLN82]|uniref:1-acyl-sn-glycerol-3-phosphate acyltransferase n=1 Tax=Pelistega ratti TaxID=2652177 RepID=A0A6L9Y6K8_9BURK|nr:lysophospholipid acyltransferase family protein [Pelistega ratti]NEN76092.1 1-acyl-sn-glycerol-3-phosphate acyltransferase [Pelistega ratti]
MIYLRSLLFYIWLILITLIFAPLTILLVILPFKKRWPIITTWNTLAIWGAKVICGIRYQIKGEENIPSYAAIYLCKHQSVWETIFFPAFFKRSLAYVYKKEIDYIPIFGWAFMTAQQIAINRKKRRSAMIQLLEQGTQRLKDDRNIFLFPEGSRMPIGQKGQYKLGGVRLAIHTGKGIIPVAHNAGICWARNAFIKKPGIITVSFGPEITPDKGLDDKALNAKVEAWIENEMRIIDPQSYHDEQKKD